MSTSVTLITVYQVIKDATDASPSPTGEFFEDRSVALEKSKPGTYDRKGHEPTEHDAVRLPDGTVRLLGKAVITPYGTGADAERAERDAAKAKLTRREREILGIRE